MNWWAKWVEAVEEAWVFIFTNKNDAKEPTVTPSPYPNPFIQVIPKPATPPMNPDTLLPWNTTSSLSHENWHNVRVLCDLEGLSVEMKNELCATVWGESEFNIHARLDNKDRVGRVWSSDLGICQYNTYFHPDVVSLPYTPDPEKEVRAMCVAFKEGLAHQWVAHSTGRFKLFLGKTL